MQLRKTKKLEHANTYGKQNHKSLPNPAESGYFLKVFGTIKKKPCYIVSPDLYKNIPVLFVVVVWSSYSIDGSCQTEECELQIRNMFW